MRFVTCLILAALVAAPNFSDGAIRKRRANPAATTAKKAGGRVSGTIVNAKGAAVLRASVWVHRLRHAGVHPRVRGGRFMTRALAPGVYIVRAHNRGAGTGRAVATVGSGGTASVVVRLHGHVKHVLHQKHALGVAHRKSKTTTGSTTGSNRALTPTRSVTK